MTGGQPGVVRLAFVYPQLKRLTGAQRLILQLASTLAMEGHHVTLVSHRVSPTCRDVLSPAVHLVVTGQRVDWTGRHLIDSVLEYGLGLGLVSRLPAELDAAVFFGPPSLPALALARQRLPYPVLSFCYEPPRFAYADRQSLSHRFGVFGPLAAMLFGLYRPVDRWLMDRAHMILANGQFGAAEIARVYGRPALVLDHGVALSAREAMAGNDIITRFRLGTAPVILTVNHLHPRKRLELFIRTIALVRQEQPNVLGVLVGEGTDRPRLEALAAQLGIGENLRWTGHVTEAELVALYRRASVYLHTGRQETFGLSVLEAAAMEVPVVAVDEGGPRDILEHGQLGRLVPADARQLADATLTLIQQPDAAARVASLAGQRVRARFRWENGARALVRAVAALRAGCAEQQAVAIATQAGTAEQANI